MRLMYSERFVPLLLGALLVTPAAAQQAPEEATVVSSDISLSREQARLRLELSDGESLTATLEGDGTIVVDGVPVGEYTRQDELDSAWRDLLQEAMDAPAGTLPGLLRDWDAPAGSGDAGRILDRRLETVLADIQTAADSPANAPDSISRLNERIRQLEQALEDPGSGAAANLPQLRGLRDELEREIRNEVRAELRGGTGDDWADRWNRPWRWITRGIAGVFSTLMAYAILVGIGFLAVFFGREYLERIADTARHQTLRAGLVGLAGGFLVLPTFILGTLALAISIVGIPLLLVWLPGFWVAIVLAGLGGFLAVAHGAGEAFAERRFTGSQWFTRANSYYYILTGVGLLLVLYIAANVVTMAGPFLGLLEGLLRFMAVMLTVIASSVGFGAVLISRAGTRGPDGSRLDSEPGLGGKADV
ncbi:MAG TPA: hypothetical protein VK966_08455 [Longimicrobiales bacterium]|nr:hypothetical protein [Longimicrobiales bacterium]